MTSLDAIESRAFSGAIERARPEVSQQMTYLRRYWLVQSRLMPAVIVVLGTAATTRTLDSGWRWVLCGGVVATSAVVWSLAHRLVPTRPKIAVGMLVAVAVPTASVGGLLSLDLLTGRAGEGGSRPEQVAPDGIAEGMRQAFAAAVANLSSDARGLLPGLVLGDTTAVTPDLHDAMIGASLSHITAVSGANCVMVIAMVHRVCVWFGMARRLRIAAAGVALAGYVALVWQEVTIWRAGAMMVLALAARCAGRAHRGPALLSAAVLVLVIASPDLATNIGFGLSVCATVGLIVISPMLAAQLQRVMVGWLAEAIAIPTSAIFGCLPLLVLLSSNISLSAIAANLLAGPVVAPATILGLLSCLLSSICPPIAAALALVASPAADWIGSVARFFSANVWAPLPWPTGISGAALGAVAVSMVAIGLVAARCWLVRTSAIALATAVLAAVVAVGGQVGRDLGAGAAVPADWSVVACDVGQGDAILYRSREQIMLIDVGRDPALVDRCLGTLGISTIDVLVLTHYDMDHVGGLRGALRARAVKRAILPPVIDERPMARSVEAEVAAKVERRQAGVRGVSGRLGAASWQVVSPRVGGGVVGDSATEIDANDASVVVILTEGGATTVMLGDLGESGQLKLLGLVRDGTIQSPVAVLKVAHHGSADFSGELYRMLRPNVAIVSVGADNRYGHPTRNALVALATSRILRTDRDGMVAVRLDARD